MALPAAEMAGHASVTRHQITSAKVEVATDTGAWHCRPPTLMVEWISGRGLGSLDRHRADRRSAGVLPPKMPSTGDTRFP